MGSWSLRLVFLGMSVVAGTAFAAQVDMPVPAPTSDHDTEATTNTVFFAGLSSDRQFNLSLELNAASSNCVEIAVGRDAVRKRRVSAIIPVVCACGMIAYAVVKNDASRVGNARSLAPVFRSQEMSLIEEYRTMQFGGGTPQLDKDVDEWLHEKFLRIVGRPMTNGK